MIGKGAQYLTAAGYGRYSITAASLGSNLMFGSLWLNYAAQQAIMDAFGVDGTAVIRATNEYLNGIAASDKAKATALADYLNSSTTIAVNWGTYLLYYQPVEYIEGTGNQYIDTGYLVNGTGRTLIVRAKVEFSTPVQQWCAIYGIQGFELIENGSSTLSVYTRTYDVADWSTQWHTEPTGVFEIIHGVGYDIIVGNDTEWHSGYALENLTSRNMYIFKSNGGMNGHKGRCYYFTMEDGGEIKRNFLPCYRKSDSVIGMWDLQNGEFKTNAGSGTFLKGADINIMPTP